jgi:hypothetical protein
VECSIDVVKENMTGDESASSSRDVLFESIKKFFYLLGIEINVVNEDSQLFSKPETGERLLIIPSSSSKTLKNYFKQLLKTAYGSEALHMANQRYLFIEIDRSDRFFNVLSSIFEHLEVGSRVKPHAFFSLFPTELPEQKQITRRDVRNEIEETCFSSGAEEMLEFFFRDPETLHRIFKYVNEKGIHNAVRMIFGAYLAGDVEKDILEKTLKAFCDEGPENFSHIKTEIKKLDPKKRKMSKNVECRFKNPLWEYLENRKILIIEDQLGREEEGWGVVLPAIFLSPGDYRDAIKDSNASELFSKIAHKTIIHGQDKAPVGITHFKDVSEALAEIQQKENYSYFMDFDLILLDLYSSGEHSKSTLLINMKHPMWQFIEQINSYRKSQKILRTSPQVIIFSRDPSGITARTMFKELNAADYFFKNAEDDAHKSGYYSSFRNAIISTLKENVLHVGGLTSNPGRKRFDRWFRQFDHCDRPVILHVMKGFRYYSALNIVHLFDHYLGHEPDWKDNRVKILTPEHRCPHRFCISYLGRPNKSGPTTLALFSKTDWIRKLRKKIENPTPEKLPQFCSYESLQEKIVKDYARAKPEEGHYCIILLDDFIGSGGQLEEYIPKFINRDLKATCRKLCESKEVSVDVWEKIKKAFRKACRKLFRSQEESADIWEKIKEAFRKEPGNAIKKLEIHAFYALGVKNEPFETLIKNVKMDENNEKGIRSINGNYSVELDDGSDISIDVKVHVANYTRSIQEIYEGKEFKAKIKKALEKYSIIKEFRAEDYSCDFEPLGWKGNGGLTVTYANAQENTIPVVWRDCRVNELVFPGKSPVKEWIALYPRYFNPLTPDEPKCYKELRCYPWAKKTSHNKQDEEVIRGICPIHSDWDKKFFETQWDWKKYKKPPCKVRRNE